MSDQLTYRVVVRVDEQSVKDTSDQLRKMQDEADKAGRQKSKKGGKKGGNADAAKEEAVALDQLTRRYMNLTKEMSSNQKAATVYRQSLQSLNKAKKDQGGLTDEQANQELALKAALADVNKDINQNKRDSVSLTQANRQLGTSYNDTKKRMAAISAELRNLQDPLGKNQEQATKLSTEYNQLNNRLKTVDKSMGNHQRNVGNYENAIRGAANAVAVFQGPLGPLAGRINSAATVLSRMAARADQNKRAMQQGAKAMTSFQRAISGNVQMLNIEEDASLKSAVARRVANAALTGYNAVAGVFYKVLTGTIPLIKTQTNATYASAVATKVANGGIIALNASLKLLRVALIATGIGALAIAVAGLFNWFTKTEAGAQKLRVIMAQLGAVVSTLQERSIAVGKAIMDAFTSPKDAVNALWNAIKTNLLNRVVAIPELFTNAFGIVSKGAQAAALSIKGIWDSDARERSKELFKQAGKDLLEFADSAQKITTGIDMGDTFGGLATEIGENVNQAGELERALNDVIVRERELGVERAETNAQLQEARDIANDTNNSFDERLTAIREAEQAEKDLLEQEIATQEERVRIMSEQDDMFSSTEEALQAVADEEAKLENMRRDAARRSLRLTRSRERVERQLAETILRRLRREVAAIERVNELDLKRRENQLLREGRALEISQERLDNFEDSYEERLEARTKAIQKELENQGVLIGAAQQAELQAKQELESEKLDLEQDVQEKERKRRIAQQNLIVNQELRTIHDRYEDEIRDAEESNDRIQELELKRQQRVEELDTTRQQRTRDLTQQLIDGGLEAEEAASEARIRIARQEADELLEIDRTIRSEKQRREDAQMRWEANSQLRALQARTDAEMHYLETRNDRVGQLELERTQIERRQFIERKKRLADLQEQFEGQGFKSDEARIKARRQMQEENEAELAANQRAIDEAVYQNKVALADATVNLAEKANSAIFGNNKIVGASIATVDTLISINKALRQVGPQKWIDAAAVAATGFANVRKILATDEKSASSGASGNKPKAPSASFGLVDTEENQDALANAVAGNTGMVNPDMNPTIILDGEFDPEALSVKVRTGNRAISGRTVNTGI